MSESASPYELAMRGVALATEAGAFTMPVDLNVSTAASAQYAGDDVAELRKRLASLGSDDHTKAFKRLAKTITPREAWDAVVDAAAVKGLRYTDMVRTLIEFGMLPNNDDLLELLRDTTEPSVAATTITQALMGSNSITFPALVEFARASEMGAKWLLQTASLHGELAPDEIDAVVEIVEAEVGTDLGVAVQMSGSNFHDVAVIRGEQSLRVTAKGTLGALVVVNRIGLRTNDVIELSLTKFGGLAIGAGLDTYESGAVTNALREAVENVTPELFYLRSKAAIWLLENHDLSGLPTDVLVQVVKQSASAHAWLAGAYRNRPTIESARKALERDMFDAAMLVGRSMFQPTYTSDWLPVIALETPGMGRELVKALRELGGQMRHSENLAKGLAALLRAVTDVFGDDERLWDRFLSLGKESPFASRELTIVQAAEVYRTRWAEADARRASA